MVFTEVGIEIEVSLEQKLKAQPPIIITEVGMEMEVREEQWSKEP